MRALIVDDHSVMRTGMRTLLEKTEGMTVVGEASTGPEAVQLARATRPDVIMMDVELPEGSGIAAAREITQNRWCQNIIMVSAHDSRTFVESALEAGAKGYVLKTGSSDEILSALEEVARGGCYVTAALMDSRVGGKPDGPRGISRATGRLSVREIQVLVEIAEGKGSRQIGEQLGISHRTVETHRMNMMRKLGIRKASELVRLAIREGLVSA